MTPAKAAASVADATTTYEDALIHFPLEIPPRRLLLPHYADSSKVGYVLKGRAIVGVLLPGETRERVVLIQEGDAIVLPQATYSWWYNDAADSAFSIVYLGGAAGGLDKEGLITYFFAAGPGAVYNGFSSQLLAKALGGGVSEDAVRSLFSSQKEPEFVELSNRELRVSPCEADREGVVVNVPAEAAASGERCRGGFVVTMGRGSRPAAMEEAFAFSVGFTRLEARAARSPGFFEATQLVRVTRGSGKVEIVGINGASEFSKEVKEGSVFVVKKFYNMAAVAGDGGMEWFSIINAERPVFNPVVGKRSPLSLMHPQVLEAALNVSSDLVKVVRSHGGSSEGIVPASE